MYKLRDYQAEIINKIQNSMLTGHRRIIVQSPPRTGKTVVMSEIARRATVKNRRVLFLIHRKEVLEQANATFKEQGVDFDLLTSGMVQTLTRRVEKMQVPHLILVDEAHHALSKSYRRILDKFKDAYVLLFTATPVRLGREQLDQVADDIVLGKSIKELTAAGFLAPFRYYQPPTGFNQSELKLSSTGDYTNKSITSALQSCLYGDLVSHYKRLAAGKQAVCYCHSIDAAKHAAAEFNKNGIAAAEVDGTTPRSERDELVKKFRAGVIKVMVNVNLFTEGVDLPDVDAVILARPTSSLSLYLQFAMRCLNPRRGKVAVIIDHANNVEKFGYPDSERNWLQLVKTGAKTRKNAETDNFNIVTCETCFAVLESRTIKAGTCPYCDALIKQKRPDKPVALIDLVEAARTENQSDDYHQLKTVGELHTMKELQAYAKLHGYKKGWCFYMAKRKGILKSRK